MFRIAHCLARHLLLPFLALVAVPAPAEARPACPAGARAVVAVVDGSVRVLTPEGGDFAARRDMRLCPGDRLVTADGARAEIRFLERNTTISLTGNTTVHLPADDTGADLDVENGLMRFISSVLGSFTIRTRYVNAGIDGTEALVAVADEGALVLVGEGVVSLTRGGERLRLLAGQGGFAAPAQGLVQAETAAVPALFAPLVADPEGASDWAVYYPPVLLADPARPEITAALAALEADDPDRAEALLEGLSDAPALALRAVIAVFRNRTAEAAALAERAVAADPGLGAAHVARSYALQAAGRIDEAARAAEIATEIATGRAPGDAYAFARLAELRLIRTDRRGALAAARQALALRPTALAEAVVGFAELSAERLNQATIAFQRAIAIADSAPLPRLGLALVRIREGRIAEGRRDIELAAALDPRRAALRTWLGRAYLAENRAEKARAQFDLARERDPDDPTALLFIAAERFAANDPLAALAAIRQAEALGPGRSVLRSERGLGEDRAVRAAAIGRVLETLGFIEEARAEAARATEEDPANGTAQRVLADAFEDDPELSYARTSATLRADLLSPPSLAPIEPARGESDLALFDLAGPARASFTEYSPFFEQDGVAARLTGFIGTQDTRGDLASFTALAEGFSIGVGQLHYQTDGYRSNNAVTHDVISLQAKGRLTPELTLFGEYRYRNTEAGDRSLEFDFANVQEPLTRNDERNLFRLGAHARLGPDQDLLGVVTATERRARDAFANVVGPSGVISEADSAFSAQAQHLARLGGGFTSQIGLSYDRTEIETVRDTVLIDPRLPFPLPNSDRRERRQTHINGYGYLGWRTERLGPLTSLEVTGGLSIDRFALEAGRAETTLNPKLGLRLGITPRLTLRSAFTRTVTPGLLFDQRLEPATVAGFAQFRPELAGARADQLAAALEYRATDWLSLGLTGEVRRVRGQIVGEPARLAARERALGASLSMALTPNVALSLRAAHERLRSQFPNDIDEARVSRISADLRWFHPSGFFAGANVAQIWQRFDDLAPDATDEGRDAAFLLGINFGYRLPSGRGVVSLDVANALDQSFGSRERALRSIEGRVGAGNVSDPLFAREPTAFLRLTLAF
ncbi:MAG: FecR domain-containing protein [Pseudomonadota bacterium]